MLKHLRRSGARWPGLRGLAVTGALLLFLVLAVIVGPLVWSRDPVQTDLGSNLQPPSFSHPMGTDGSGRDVLARFLAGAQVSLSAGLVVVILSGLTGTLLGLLSGIVRGVTDLALMRVLDVLLAFPQLILAMAVSIGLGPSLNSAVIGIALGCVPVYARLVRTEALQIQTQPYVDAAKTLGLSSARIAVSHIVPGLVPTLLVQSAAVFGSTVVSLSALGFVGLGAQIPTAEWGAMIAEGMSYTLTGGWWVSFWPGLGLFLVVVAANLLTDGISHRFTASGARPW